MVAGVTQGSIWWAETEADRRPVLVVTRDQAIAVLAQLIVAPVTSTARRIATEIELGPEEGLAFDCVASFDSLQPLKAAYLTERAGELGQQRRHEICDALAALADC